MNPTIAELAHADEETMRLHAERIVAEQEASEELVALMDAALQAIERDPATAARKAGELAQSTRALRRALETHWARA